ncbi:16S rRNA (uracil(1498)-N(3))-methyltransferase [Chamaesiphon sp.]|uniref:16S rRNA (uracil(1498)-N(3))-methyltransferase n=1 Tax=Chamaesiphon sp. TaxID=2814140 RepID=UPI0035941509
MQRITINPSQIHGSHIAIDPAQDRYLTRVLRLQPGDRFQAIDGTGKLYLCAIAASSAQPGAEIIEIGIPAAQRDGGSFPLITLICALPKGNNFDDLVRACTELGVTTIYPAISDRTLLNPSPQKLQRWRKIAQEAAEQSERLTISTITEPQTLATIFAQLPTIEDSVQTHSARYLCEARGTHPHLLECLQSTIPTASDIIIAIGPEGGWTQAEIELAIEYDFRLVSLGRQILRTITAPIVALAIVTAATNANPRPQVLI